MYNNNSSIRVTGICYCKYKQQVDMEVASKFSIQKTKIPFYYSVFFLKIHSFYQPYRQYIRIVQPRAYLGGGGALGHGPPFGSPE